MAADANPVTWLTLIEIFANLAVVIATGLAAWAAWESRRAANASLLGTQAPLVLAFISEYFSDEMGNALKTLRQWNDAHGNDSAAKWEEGIKTHDAEAERVEVARRRVKGYFNRAARLHRAGLLTKEALREVSYTAGINIYFDVVLPMDVHKKVGNRDRTAAILEQNVGRYEEGFPRF